MKTMQQLLSKVLQNFNIFDGENISDLGTLAENMKHKACEALLQLLQDFAEKLDQEIYLNKSFRKKYQIVRRDDIRKIQTSLGELVFRRNYYRNKTTLEYCYPVDEMLTLTPHAKIDDRIKTNACRQATYKSFKTTGEEIAETVISKQSIKNYVKNGAVIQTAIPSEKAKVKVLYVEADEDHVALQNKSGKKRKKGTRNIAEPRLVYLHEGHIKQTPNSKKTALKNIRYLSFTKESPDDIWEKVLTCIDNYYDLEYIDTIFVAGDGATWIKKALEWLPKSKYILDEFHLQKYVNSITAKNVEDKINLKKELKNLNIDACNNIFTKSILAADDEKKKLKIIEKCKYIINNWEGIRNLYRNELALSCSAEGHISHVLSARLSSRPMAWSMYNLEKMASFRVALFNKDTIVYRSILKAQLRENDVLSRSQINKIFKSVRNNFKRSGAEIRHNMPAIKIGLVNPTYSAIATLKG